MIEESYSVEGRRVVAYHSLWTVEDAENSRDSTCGAGWLDERRDDALIRGGNHSIGLDRITGGSQSSGVSNSRIILIRRTVTQSHLPITNTLEI